MVQGHLDHSFTRSDDRICSHYYRKVNCVNCVARGPDGPELHAVIWSRKD